MGILATLAAYYERVTQRKQLREVPHTDHATSRQLCRRCGCDTASCREFGCTPPDDTPYGSDRLRTSDPGMTGLRTSYEHRRHG